MRYAVELPNIRYDVGIKKLRHEVEAVSKKQALFRTLTNSKELGLAEGRTYLFNRGRHLYGELEKDIDRYVKVLEAAEQKPANLVQLELFPGFKKE